MRTFLVVAAVLSGLLLAFPVNHAAAQPTVGIYTDASGTSCTLSDQTPGVVNAYVVARHDPLSGVRAIQFSAPKPACFAATFLMDVPAPDAAIIGESQTGIAVSLSYCSPTPVHLLTIQYYGMGTTPACCEFPILPDPNAGSNVLIADCSYTEIAATGLVSRINADASCPCTGNSPPFPPVYPSPGNLSTFEPLDVDLSWSSIDPDGDALVYDVYLGTSSPAPLLASGIAESTYDPGTLLRGVQYFWRVVARDSKGAETSGPEWTFTTRTNYAPTTPNSPSPLNQATRIALNVTLAWESLDFDGDPITYDVYFGTSSTPPLVATDIATRSYAPGGLVYLTDYYWRIVARDDHGGETSGPVWLFTTREPNEAPWAPGYPLPIHNAINQSVNVTMTWQAADMNGDVLVYDVYFGTSPSPPLVATNLTFESYTPGLLDFSTAHYWRVVARDPEGLETSGPVWQFTTSAYTPPNPPMIVAPGNGAIVVPGNLTLDWSANDPDGQALAFDVHFGTTNPPPLVQSGLTTSDYPAGIVTDGVTYFWRVVVSDGVTAVSGPVWSFLATDAARSGDVNGDGVLTIEDANCALDLYVGNTTCAGPWGAELADVNCDGSITPADARCIHQRVLGGPCPLCATQAAAAPGATAPVVYVQSHWIDGYFQHVVLGVVGTVNLTAFGFRLTPSPNIFFTGVSLSTAPLTQLRHSTAGGGIVGGYSLNGVGTSPSQLIHLTFLSFTNDYAITVHSFVDDLAGAPNLLIDDGGPVPVLFSRFDAEATDGGVDVRWKLSADEAMEWYTLYRRDDGAPTPVAIADGPVEGTTDSYLDRAVEPGHTYRYELVIRTENGDEFRSPVASARTRELALALHQNHPNPFNPQTTIRYDVPGGGSRVHLAIYDLQGGLVRTLVDESQAAGSYSVDWTATDEGGNRVASGVYFYVLDAGRERLTRKLVLLK